MNSSDGERLKAARRFAGLTQSELAKRSGLGQSAIGNIESGIRGFGASVIKMAQALGVDPHWLATGDGAMQTSHTTQNIKFSLPAEDQAPIAQALQSLDAHLKALAPVLHDSGREVLRKWAIGAATVAEVADALEAMALASESMKNKKD